MGMYDELMNMINDMNDIEVDKTNNFIAMVTIRDSLINDHGFGDRISNGISSGIKIAISNHYSDEKIIELALAYTKIVSKVLHAFDNAGYSEDDVVATASELTLSLD